MGDIRGFSPSSSEVETKTLLAFLAVDLLGNSYSLEFSSEPNSSESSSLQSSSKSSASSLYFSFFHLEAIKKGLWSSGEEIISGDESLSREILLLEASTGSGEEIESSPLE